MTAARRRVLAAAGVAGLLALPGSQSLLTSPPPRTVSISDPTPAEAPAQALQVSPLWPELPSSQPTLPVPLSAPVAPGPAPYGVTSPSAMTSSGIPAAAYRAYLGAAAQLGRTDPSCGIQWSLIAGIGRVESNHGRYGGSTIGANGIVTPPILGVRLDGSRRGTARISDSDGGRYDGDTVTDRAVGPMQFLPGTWKAYGAGANPQDMNAAALAAARYLCAGHGNLRTAAGRWAAVYRYNHSDSYVSLVLSLASSYQNGAVNTFPGRSAGPSQSTRPSPAPTRPRPRPTPSAPATSSPASPSTSPSASPSAAPTGAPSSSPPSSSPPSSSPPSSPPPSSPPVTPSQGPTSAPPTPTGSPASPTPGGTQSPSPSCPASASVSVSATPEPSTPSAPSASPSVTPCASVT